MASVVCLVLLCLSYSVSKAQNYSVTGQLDPNQTYTTGNIVQNTPQGGPTPWVNGVYQDNLTCWSGGDPGYCGPNAIVRPGGNINFSYGSTYLYQQQAVASILPNSGTGLQVSGYNFGFTAKNGNGWDDGSTDSLIALVRLWDSTGGRGKDNLLYGTSYDLNYKFNWNTFNYSETFSTPLAAPSIGQVQYGFIGRDNNGWAGPYGPEIYNVRFNLTYKVDPCATNILSSPTCPGYLEALAKLTPPPTPVVEVQQAPILAESTLVAPTAVSTGNQSLSGSPVTTDNTQAPQSQVQQSGVTSTGATSPIQQAATSQPSATNPQTKIGEVSDSGGGSKSTVSLSSVLNIISSNQEKTAALEKSVVQAADAQAFSAGETAKQQAEKIAGDAQSQSIANSSTSQSSASQLSGGQSSVMQIQGSAASLQGNLQSNNIANTARLQQSHNSSSGVLSESGLNNVTSFQQNNFQQSTRQDFNVSIVTPSVSYSLSSPNRYTPQTLIELPTTEGIKFGGYKGPVDSAMESRSIQPQTNQNQQQLSSVNKNAQNNDAAGNVTIDSIAKQPVGYAQYFGILPDVSFYAPKEIYRNQRTVDNARIMRGLTGGSDAKHQQMVDQQYK